MTTPRWLFGDQLGPHFLDGDEPVLMIESKAVFARRRFHRAKAHLVLSAMRHRAAELGDRCTYVRSDRYADAVTEPVTVCHPTSRAALALVRRLPGVEVLPARGYATSMDRFATWADGRGQRRLLLEDFYRDARRRFDVLMDGDEPVGGKWNYDHENRDPAPRSGNIGVPAPGGRSRTRSMPRCGRIWTAGSGTARWGSSARTGRAGSPPPGVRH